MLTSILVNYIYIKLACIERTVNNYKLLVKRSPQLFLQMSKKEGFFFGTLYNYRVFTNCSQQTKPFT